MARADLNISIKPVEIFYSILLLKFTNLGIYDLQDSGNIDDHRGVERESNTPSGGD